MVNIKGSFKETNRTNPNRGYFDEASKVAILVMDYGTPHSLEGVQDYFTSIRRGIKPTETELQDLVRRYRCIGGVSPLQESTHLQGQLLQEVLSKTYGKDFQLYYAHKFVEPTLEMVARQIVADKMSHVIGIALAPFESQAIGESYFGAVRTILMASQIEFLEVTHWEHTPGFTSFWAEQIQASMQRISAGESSSITSVENEKILVLFTAHSMPKQLIDKGDLYAQSFSKAAKRIQNEWERLHRDSMLNQILWRQGFQSAGKRGEWLTPTIDTVTLQAQEEGVSVIIYVPIGFTAAHLEVLYDLDQEMRAKCKARGIHFERAMMPSEDALNTIPRVDTIEGNDSTNLYIRAMIESIGERIRNS